MEDVTGQEVENMVRDDAMIGHRRIIELLARALERGRLAHAYLFVGAAHIGKMTLARTFAESLLGGSVPLARHPDFFLVERGKDPKTDKMRSGIVLDQIRELRTRLSMGAMMRGWKAVILDDAHLMNTESANALLKSLEEPHDRTLLLLLADSSELVLPTIRSRCQVVQFNRVRTDTIAHALVVRGVTESDAALWARLADGCPGKAMAYACDSGYREEMMALRDTLLQIPAMPLADRMTSLDTLLPKKTSFIESGIIVHDVLRMFAELLRDTVLLAYGQDDRVVHVDVRERLREWHDLLGYDRTVAALQAIAQTRRMVDDNVNPRAALEHFVLVL